MAFESSFEKITSSYRKRLGNTQAQIDCKMPVEDGVSRVVCNNAKSYIVSAEVVGKDVVYRGFVSFLVLYYKADGNVESLDYTAEFSETYPVGNANDFVPIVSVDVVDVTTQNSNGGIKVVATIETTIDGVFSVTQNVLTDVSGDNIFAQKEDYKYSSFKTVINEKFNQNYDVEIKDGVSKVLSVCPTVYMDSLDVADRFLTVKGGVDVNITYLTDNNMLQTAQSKFDFTQEIANDDIEENMFVQSIVQLAFNDVKITTSIDTNVAMVNIEMPVIYTGVLFEEKNTQIVGDLFSTTHYTGVSVNSVDSLAGLDEKVFEEKLSGSVTIKDNAPFIDEVLGVCCSNLTVANATVENSTLTIEGVGHTTVLYYNKEQNEVNSVEVEMPFSYANSVDAENATPLVQVSLVDIAVRSRRGKEIEVTSTLNVYADMYLTESGAVITEVTKEDEIPEDECALSIYFAKDNNTIWEIAKELRVSPEMLLEQNVDLTEPIPAGKRIVIYRQKEAEY